MYRRLIRKAWLRWRIASETVAFWVFSLIDRLDLVPTDTVVKRALAGLRDGCWTYVCGHDLKFSVQIAMIWWTRLWRSQEKGR